MELQAGCRFPFGYDSAFLAYVDMLYGRLELRFGPLSQQGPEEARHWFPRLDFLLSAALSRNDEVLHCGTNCVVGEPQQWQRLRHIFSAPVDMASLAVDQEHV